MSEEEEELEPEPEPELTPMEKIANLKSALSNGDMGPAEFDKEYQSVWLEIKEKEGMVRQSRDRGSSVAAPRPAPPQEEDDE